MSDFSFSKVIKDKPGWYRGDFHVHSDCSDGDYPVGTVTLIAEAEGLDFYAITDHNTIEAFKSLEEEHKTLVIPGLEVTFRLGHFNVFGLRDWADWMEGIVEIVPSKLDDGVDGEVAALPFTSARVQPFPVLEENLSQLLASDGLQGRRGGRHRLGPKSFLPHLPHL